MSDPIRYERKFGKKQIVAEALTLNDTHLLREVRSGAKRTHEIPVAKIQGFYAENIYIEAAGLRSGIAAASQAIAQVTGLLFINWEQDGKRRKTTFHVDGGDPGFLAIYRALRTRRPDACLERLSEKEARKKLGRLTKEGQSIVFIAVVIGAVLLWGGINSLLK